MKRAIFIDRDGVINKLPPKYPNEGVGDIRNYITKWEDFEFLDGVMEAFGIIAKDARYKPIIISNQGGAIGRGLIDYDTILDVFVSMDIAITQAISGYYEHEFYFCPHAHADRCCCCKPKPGMLYQAAIEHDICLEDSWMIGDSFSDLKCGYNAHLAKLIKIGRRVNESGFDFIAKKDYLYVDAIPRVIAPIKDSLLEAVKYIMETDNGNQS